MSFSINLNMFFGVLIVYKYTEMFLIFCKIADLTVFGGLCEFVSSGNTFCRLWGFGQLWQLRGIFPRIVRQCIYHSNYGIIPAVI